MFKKIQLIWLPCLPAACILFPAANVGYTLRQG
jgi:hypothetical protein